MITDRRRCGFVVGFATALTVWVFLMSAPAGAQLTDQLSGSGLQAAPVNPAFEKYLAERTAVTEPKTTSTGHFLGFIPPPLKLPAPAAPMVSSEQAAALPTSFDLRISTPVGVTGVKDQHHCGSCWAFGGMASLESYLQYKKTTTADFSEADLNENHGFDYGVCMGGNWVMSTAYMARWGGPVNEVDVPYPAFLEVVEAAAAPEEDTSIPSVVGITPGVATKYHVQNVYFLPQSASPLSAADMATLKQAIQDNGAVTIAFYMDNTYYNSTNHSFYCSVPGLGQNHEVAIVGWKDGYAKTKFNSPPPGDGAFIVKNSWGTGWGDSGYFYMSYYDKSLSIGAQFLDAGPTSTYTRIYQYDPLGWINSYGYTSGTKTLAWFSNIFMASANASKIKAVSLYTPVPNATYAVVVYSNVTPGQPRSGKKVSYQTGTIVKPGYNTIPLPSGTGTVAANKPFSVVVKLTTPGYDYPIPVEQKWFGYTSAASSCPGQSYVSHDGTNWSSTGGDYNVCLKALALK